MALPSPEQALELELEELALFVLRHLEVMAESDPNFCI